MDVANKRANLNALRKLLHRGMRDTTSDKKRKDGTKAQRSTYYQGLYAFSTVSHPKEIKIGMSTDLYQRINNHRLCFPVNFFVNFLVITREADGHKEGYIGRLLEKEIHNKLKKVPGSYSIEWGQIHDITKLREMICDVLNDHPTWWRYIIAFSEDKQGRGMWKITSNHDGKTEAVVSDFTAPSVSRPSQIVSLSEDIMSPSAQKKRGKGVSEEELIQKAIMKFYHLPEAREIVGKGVISDTIQKIKEWFFAPSQLNGTSQKVYDETKDWVIQKLMVNRVPVNSMVEKLINVISGGTYQKAKKDLHYDKMFHLSLVMYTDKGVVSIEKNERVNLQKGGTGGGESIDIAFKGLDIDTFLANGLDYMGSTDFYTYDVFTRNCQDFVLNLLESNGALTSDVRDFIKQDALAILAKMPPYVSKITRGLTDFGAKLNQLITGRGRKKKTSCGC